MARTVAQTSHQKKETGQTGKPNGEYALQAADRPGGEGQSEEGTAEQEQKPQGRKTMVQAGIRQVGTVQE